MPITPAAPLIPIPEFFARLKPFQLRAGSKDRISEYLNHGDDTGYETRVFYELLMSLMQDNDLLHAQIAKLNQVLGTEE